MIASITRTVMTTSGSQNDDLTWMNAWAGIEMSVAVIVACLCSFRALFTSQSRSQRTKAYKASSSNDLESGKRRGLSNQEAWDSSALGSGLPRKALQRRTLYPLDTLDTFFTRSGSFTDASVTTELRAKWKEDMRQLRELELDATAHPGRVLVRNSVTISNEPALAAITDAEGGVQVHETPIPIHVKLDVPVRIETLASEQSWLKV